MSRAPATHLYYNDSQHGDIITQSAMVPSYGDSVDTYYCGINWNAGQEGGGYCGLQHRRDGTCFIYSLWNPPHSHDHVRLVYHSPHTQVSTFGGEGTGLRSLNFNFGWRHDQWYTLVSRAWDGGGNNTRFGFWVQDQSAGKWENLVIYEYPRPNVKFTSGTASFVEDFIGTGQYPRGLWTKDGYRRILSGSWIPMTSAVFSVGVEASSAQHANAYNAEATSHAFYQAAGGNNHPHGGLTNNQTLKLTGSMPSKPPHPAINFSLTSASANHVSWYVPANSTPQFSYAVSVDGKYVAYGDDTMRRSASYAASAGQKVTVTVEDILGNKVTQTHTVS